MLGEQATVGKTRAIRDLGNVAERDDAADEFPVAVEKSLAIYAEHSVGLFGRTINCHLVGKLLTVAGAYERQLVGITVAIAVAIDTAECLFPGRVRLRAWTEAENGSGGRVDIKYVSGVINNNRAVINIAKYRQHRDVGFGQALLQAAALHGVVENRVLAFDRNVVDADIALGADAQGGDAAMFMFLPGQRYDRIRAE